MTALAKMSTTAYQTNLPSLVIQLLPITHQGNYYRLQAFSRYDPPVTPLHPRSPPPSAAASAPWHHLSHHIIHQSNRLYPALSQVTLSAPSAAPSPLLHPRPPPHHHLPPPARISRIRPTASTISQLGLHVHHNIPSTTTIYPRTHSHRRRSDCLGTGSRMGCQGCVTGTSLSKICCSAIRSVSNTA